MTDDQHPEVNAHTEHQKALLAFGMLRIVNDSGEFIQKDGPGFGKGNSMLLLIGTVFPRVPLKAQVRHTYSVPTECGESTLP